MGMNNEFMHNIRISYTIIISKKSVDRFFFFDKFTIDE
jgi:hypothetical protein